MRENSFYHGPIFSEMRESIREQFQIGDTIEISDLGSDGHTLKGFKKIKIMEKYRHFLVAIATDPTPSEHTSANVTHTQILQLSCTCVRA